MGGREAALRRHTVDRLAARHVTEIGPLILNDTILTVTRRSCNRTRMHNRWSPVQKKLGKLLGIEVCGSISSKVRSLRDLHLTSASSQIRLLISRRLPNSTYKLLSTDLLISHVLKP